jgi:hypothetical protein
MLEIAKQIAENGLPMAALLALVGAISFFATRLWDIAVKAVERAQRRREALLAAYVDVKSHTHRSRQVSQPAFIDGIVATIERYERGGDRFRPFVPKVDHNVGESRLEPFLYTLPPQTCEALHTFFQATTFESKLVDMMQSDAFERLTTERKIAFFRQFQARVADVAKKGARAERLLGTYIEFGNKPWLVPNGYFASDEDDDRATHR